MIEMLSLVFFGLVIYTFLIVVPTMVERVTSDEFKEGYFGGLNSKHVNSYGK